MSPRIAVLRGVGPSAANRRKDRCKYGHIFDGYRARSDRSGRRRFCRACEARTSREYWRRQHREAVA